MRKPSPQLLDPLAACSRGVAHLALALRELVLIEAPDAAERVYKNHPSAIWFGFGPKDEGPKMNDMFCYIATARSHVNLGFTSGASLPDPDHVLEGEGKMMRHIKFRTERDLERSCVRRYIRAAAEHARSATTKAPREIVKRRRPRGRGHQA
jgi:hypothetical protein